MAGEKRNFVPRLNGERFRASPAFFTASPRFLVPADTDNKQCLDSLQDVL